MGVRKKNQGVDVIGKNMSMLMYYARFVVMGAGLVFKGEIWIEKENICVHR